MVASPTVFIVDDDPGLLRSWRYLVESDQHSVETFHSPESFLDAYDPRRPGCLIVDLRMPGLSGIDVINRLVQRGATLPVIVVTGYGDVQSCSKAFKRGAIDFLEKPVDDGVLLELVRKAIDSDAATRRELAGRGEVEQRIARLTDREREVMDRLIAGREMKHIAQELNVSIQTVAKHRMKLFYKLKVESDVELVHLVLEHRVVERS